MGVGVVLLLVLLALSSLPQRLWGFYRKCRALRAIPGWPTSWLWGNLHQLKMDKATLLKTLAYVQENRYRITKLWLGPFVPLVMINHCNSLEKVMKLPDDFAYSSFRDWLGTGLATVTTKKGIWSHNRRLLAPAFRQEILKGYIPVTNSCLEEFIN